MSNILTSKQCEENRAIFNELSIKIEELKDEVNKTYDSSSKTALDKLSKMNKLAAYDDCFNLFRNYSDYFLSTEGSAIDQKLRDNYKALKDEFSAITNLGSKEELTKEDIDAIKNIIVMAASTLKHGELLLKQLKE